MENEASNRRSSSFDVDLEETQLDLSPYRREELPDDYAQWLDQRRFDDEQEPGQ